MPCSTIYRDWAGAEQAFQRALQLKPNSATTLMWYSEYLTAMGQRDEATAAATRARDLDPLSLVVTSYLGGNYYNWHDYDEAIRRLRVAVDLDPGFPSAHVMLGQAYAEKAMYEASIAEFQKAMALTGSDLRPREGLGYVYALSGRRTRAEEILNELSALRREGYVSPYHSAVIYAGLGENDKALLWLERAVGERSQWIPFCGVSPVFENLHSDPRFVSLLSRMGLVLWTPK